MHVLSAGLTVTAVSCSDASCKTNGLPAILAHVVDTAGAPVCDAKVTVHDGAFSEVLRVAGDSSTSCSYSGPNELAGTYRVEASARGAVATVEHVKVTADACHVHTQDVTLTLDIPHS